MMHRCVRICRSPLCDGVVIVCVWWFCDGVCVWFCDGVCDGMCDGVVIVCVW